MSVVATARARGASYAAARGAARTTISTMTTTTTMPRRGLSTGTGSAMPSIRLWQLPRGRGDDPGFASLPSMAAHGLHAGSTAPVQSVPLASKRYGAVDVPLGEAVPAPAGATWAARDAATAQFLRQRFMPPQAQHASAAPKARRTGAAGGYGYADAAGGGGAHRQSPARANDTSAHLIPQSTWTKHWESLRVAGHTLGPKAYEVGFLVLARQRHLRGMLALVDDALAHGVPLTPVAWSRVFHLLAYQGKTEWFRRTVAYFLEVEGRAVARPLRRGEAGRAQGGDGDADPPTADAEGGEIEGAERADGDEEGDARLWPPPRPKDTLLTRLWLYEAMMLLAERGGGDRERDAEAVAAAYEAWAAGVDAACPVDAMPPTSSVRSPRASADADTTATGVVGPVGTTRVGGGGRGGGPRENAERDAGNAASSARSVGASRNATPTRSANPHREGGLSSGGGGDGGDKGAPPAPTPAFFGYWLRCTPTDAAARRVFDAMARWHVIPTHRHYEACIAACEAGGDTDRAACVLDTVRRHKIPLTIEMLVQMLKVEGAAAAAASTRPPRNDDAANASAGAATGEQRGEERGTSTPAVGDSMAVRHSQRMPSSFETPGDCEEGGGGGRGGGGTARAAHAPPLDRYLARMHSLFAWFDARGVPADRRALNIALRHACALSTPGKHGTEAARDLYAAIIERYGPDTHTVSTMLGMWLRLRDDREVRAMVAAVGEGGVVLHRDTQQAVRAYRDAAGRAVV